MKKFITNKYNNLRAIHRAHYANDQIYDKTRLVIFIILLVITSQLAINLYLPSMPDMVNYFKTDVSHIQLSITIYLLGYGASQFFYGPLSDVYGRRWIIIAGLSIFVIASILCASAFNIKLFLLGRFLQGIGLGCGDTMGRAILCERFDNKAFVRAACQISIAATVTPMLGPVLGGYIQEYFGWRMSFIVILLYGINVTFLMFYYLPETKPSDVKNSISIKQILKNYYRILTDRIFLAFFLPGVACFVGETIYNIMSSFLLQNELGWSATAFGWLNTTTIIGLLLGSVTTNYLSKFISHSKMVFYGMCILVLSSIGMLIPSLFHILNTPSLLIPMGFYMAGIGMIYPNTNMGALSPFTSIAGTAGALQGGMQMLCGGLLGIFVGDAFTPTQFPLAATLTGLSVVCFTFFVVLLRTNR